MEKINIAEILKDCPKGMELDCTMYDNVVFEGVDQDECYPIKVKIKEHPITLSLTKYGCWNLYNSAKCIIFPKGKTTWEGFVPPCKFKDGDVLVHTQNGRFIMSIYKSNENEKLINTHVVFWDREEGLSVGVQICCYTDNVRFATKEEKAKLFQAIKDNGYKWNANTNTLEKLPETKFKVGDRIKNKNVNLYHTVNSILGDSYIVDDNLVLEMKMEHLYELAPDIKPKFKIGDRIKKDKDYISGIVTDIFDDSFKVTYDGGGCSYVQFHYQGAWDLVPDKFDITTLVPFESRVLVRDNNQQKWSPAMWGYYDCDSQDYPYKLVGSTTRYRISYEGKDAARYCIPYEGNEHLLGTTKDCDDYYKIW